MAVKTTLRLPDTVARRLRELSAVEHRSFNDIAVRVLQAGLGDAVQEDQWWRDLGDLVSTPPVGRFDAEEWQRRRQERGVHFTRDQVRTFMEAFELEREDRF